MNLRVWLGSFGVGLGFFFVGIASALACPAMLFGPRAWRKTTAFVFWLLVGPWFGEWWLHAAGIHDLSDPEA